MVLDGIPQRVSTLSPITSGMNSTQTSLATALPIVGHTYMVPLKCWHPLQLGVVAHSCDSAAGELGLWIVVGWDPLDEAGHVELVSALSLVSTWAPTGSRRWPGGLMSQEPGQVGHRATQTGHMRQ